MSEENNQEPPAEAVESQQPEPQGKSFSQEEVNDIIGKRVKRVESKYEAQIAELTATVEKLASKSSRAGKPKPEPSGPPEWFAPVAEGVQALRTEIDQLKQEKTQAEQAEAFKATTAGYEIPPEALPGIRRAFDPENPEQIKPLLAPYKPKEQPDYKHPGVSGAGSVERLGSPMEWGKSRETVERLKSQGKLREAWESGLGFGQSSNPFAARRKNKG